MNERSRIPRVMLAFRAHQPLIERARLTASPLGQLAQVAETLGAPLSLAVSNELVHQLKRDLPDAFARLRAGFVARMVRPLYLPAHHAPSALLSPAELADELRLNQECVHGLLAAPRPSRRGLLVAESGLDPRLVPSVEEGGYDFTLQAAPEEAVRSDASYDYAHRPFRIGERLVALPVVALALTLDRDDNLALLRAILDAAPERASIVFLHELGELELVQQAWSALRQSEQAFELTAPEELFENDALTPPWLPEVRLATELELEIEPVDEDDGGDPFEMWQGGKPLSRTLEWLVDAFGFSRTPALPADTLFDDDYQLDGLPPRAQVPLYLRRIKAACHVALDADAGLPQRPYLDGYRLCDALDRECKLSDTQPQAGTLQLEQLERLGRLPELLVDPRVAYHRVELERLREEPERARAVAAELEAATTARKRAEDEITRAIEAYAALADAQFRGRARWRAVVRHLRDHLGAVCVALDHLDRATHMDTREPTLEPLAELGG
jgi:hypothetical protein